MVWCHKRKVIFVHIPKTGGTSIEMRLGMRGLSNGYEVVNCIAKQHYRWRNYVKELGNDKFKEYYKFAVCRNPYTRFLSEYYWCEIPGMGHRHGQSFVEFLGKVEKIVKEKQFKLTKYHDHFIPQWRFVFDNNGVPKLDKVLRFESFEEVDNFLKDKFGAVGNEHQKKSGNKKYVLTSQDKERIYAMYQKDFELFGYEK